jgi:alpha-N-arabinofuranosidase
MHPKGSEVTKEKYLFEQQSTMRDAVIAAYNLNLFNNRCDFVKMANIAQISNCLHALFLVDGEKFTVTPTYYVYDMFKTHQGATCYQTQTEDSELSVSASQKDDILTITIANLSCKTDKSVQLSLADFDGKVRGITQTTLGNGNMRAHNTFTRPNAVLPTVKKAYISRDIEIPKASVITLTITLA